MKIRFALWRLLLLNDESENERCGRKDTFQCDCGLASTWTDVDGCEPKAARFYSRWQSGTNEHMQRYCPQIEGEWYLVSHLQRQGDLYQKDTFDRGGSYSHDCHVSRQILNSFLVVLCDVNFMTQHQYEKAYFSSLIACSANSSTLSKIKDSYIYTG
jgi:hypothetical protein